MGPAVWRIQQTSQLITQGRREGERREEELWEIIIKTTAAMNRMNAQSHKYHIKLQGEEKISCRLVYCVQNVQT